MAREISPLDRARQAYAPRLPRDLAGGPGGVGFAEEAPAPAGADAEAIRERFPRTYGRPALRLVREQGALRARALRVGVVLSGGQAPGGHNVIAGLHDALVALHPGAGLVGFPGGPRGVIEGRARELDAETLRPYRNAGGFDLIGSGRDKIETPEQLEAARLTCERLRLDGLVVVGGDDSNTNAAVLAETFAAAGSSTAVVGVPKTIDGDMKGHGIETSFGFDTATKVYAELVGNICRDAASAGKYWHFVKLMGRSASHVALECGLRTRANVTLIGEEVEQRGWGLEQVVDRVARSVERRAAQGRRYGVCIVPEGLIEFVPELRALIGELNRILHEDEAEPARDAAAAQGRRASVEARLSAEARRVFASLPSRIRDQLLLDRDSHGNVQVSKIDTETMLVEMVGPRLAARGGYDGRFQAQTHFFGYEGRCAAPSNFDADYTFALGHVAAALVAGGRGGYICAVHGLAGAPESWSAAAVPLTAMMRIETRKGRPTPVIGKALVRTDGPVFRHFAERRDRWEVEDDYVYPGAIQYFGPPEVCDAPALTVLLEQGRAPLPD